MTAAVSGVYGSEALGQSCEDFGEAVYDHLGIIADNMSPVDYEEFVEEYCNGQPYACPGNLNIPEDPLSGSTLDCSAPFQVHCANAIIMNTRPAGNSMSDVFNALTFTAISVESGYWRTQDYGHLVGIIVEHNPPPGDNEIY